MTARGVEEDTWNVLLMENAELARWLSFRELMQIGLLNRSFKSMFERALGFVWRSRSAACARGELSHTVKRAVRFGKAEHVRILMPLVVRAAEPDGEEIVMPYLFDAIRHGHGAVVSALLEIGGPELPMMTDTGESCLAVSVRFRRAELVGVLLEAAGPRERELFMMNCLCNVDYSDMSCLHYSVYRGDLVMVNTLLEAADGAGVLEELLMLSTDSGDTCLHMAAEYCLLPRGLGVVQALLKAAGPRRLELLVRRSGPGESCLLIAASVGSVDVVNVLLEAAGPARRELLMLTNLVGHTCLYASVEEGRVAAMRALLEAADRAGALAELLMLTNCVGQSCLHVGVKEGRADVVRALLEAAGPWRRELLMLPDGNGASCLYLSVLRGNLAMANALLEAAGDDALELLMLVRNTGDSCLHAGARSGRVDMVRALLEAAGPRRHELLVLQKDDGFSALHVACASAHLDIVQALVEAAGVHRRELLLLTSSNGDTCMDVSAIPFQSRV
jgi:ankyrin repeat protein